MARWRRAIELAMTDEEIESLRALSRSRTEPARRVERARMLLAYRETPSFYAVGRSLGTHHQTVERCVERALAYGLSDVQILQYPADGTIYYGTQRSRPAWDADQGELSEIKEGKTTKLASAGCQWRFAFSCIRVIRVIRG